MVDDICPVNEALREYFILANCQDTPQSVLVLLSSHNHEIIRGAVASNYSVPLHVLDKLGNDPSEYVRECVRSRRIMRTHVVMC